MATWPNKTTLFNTGISGANANPLMQAWFDVARQMPGALTTARLVITNDAITPVQASHYIDTEGGAAADNLTSISRANMQDGALLMLRQQDAARVITVKHNNAANGILTVDGGAIVLQAGYPLLLELRGDRWYELESIQTKLAMDRAVTAQSAAAAAQSAANTAKNSASAAQGEADAVGGALTTHSTATAAHSATSGATASRMMIRDASGRAQVATPSAAADIATKGYVDGKVPSSGAAPKPIATAGVGQVYSLVVASGLPTLPSGGTWAWFALPYRSALGDVAIDTTMVGKLSGVSAGGSKVGVLAGDANACGVVCWRIA